MLKLRILAVVVAFFGLFGCSKPGASYSVVLPSTVTADQGEAAATAVERWQAMVPELRLTLLIADGACEQQSGVICVSFSAEAPPEKADDSGCVLGLTTYDDRNDSANTTIYDVSSLNQGIDVAKVMTHELGHAMGLVHHSLVAVMNPSYSVQTGAPTADDVAQWRSLR